MRYIKYISIIIIFFTLSSCKKNVQNNDDQTDSTHKITILYTNDEHGWIEKSEYTNGAANLMGLWRDNEEYDGDESYLILSGGDNWTGPAISTWFEGESTVDVMNAMEYDASAIGNHEFDFKVDGFYNRVEQANYPYLSANIRNKNSGEIPDFATPYIIKDIDGVLVGIIGLSSISTSWTTFPDNVENFEFISYTEALEEIVPTVKENGAEIMIVIAHICNSEITELTNLLIDLDISLITGGHCHGGIVGRVIKTARGQVGAIKASSYMTSYSKAEITYNINDQKVTNIDVSGHLNNEADPDPIVESAVNYWREQTDLELSEIVGYTDTEINVQSAEMYNMVVDSWLYKYADADIAMSNDGGIRQSIPVGNITKETIIGVLPFQNYIIELQLSGAEVIQCAQYDDMIFGGMTTIGGYNLSDGSEIDENTIYSVLTTDFLFAQSDQLFSQFDPNPYYTSMNYYQPTIDWISSLNTNSSNPLSSYLDGVARR